MPKHYSKTAMKLAKTPQEKYDLALLRLQGAAVHASYDLFKFPEFRELGSALESFFIHELGLRYSNE